MMRCLLLCFLLLLCILPVSAADLIGPDSYPPGVNPLTGLPADPDNLNRRPMIVKISNAPAVVRPQSGLNSADIVWEYVIEGGYTRFSAIFYSQDVDKVGPVRSSRLVDLSLIRIYNALLVHSGSSQGVLDRLRATLLDSSRNLGGGPCPPLCRVERPGVAFEHTLFGDTTALRARFVELGKDVTPDPVRGMAFDEAPPTGGVAVSGIKIDYREAHIRWNYDAADGKWRRFQDGEPHLDANTNTQVEAANVVIVEADHIDQPVVYDGYWGYANYATEPDLTGTGRLILFRDGQYFEGEWRRADDESPLEYFDLVGNTLPFKPGNTFVQLVPRWYSGYELTFLLPQPLNVTVTVPSAILRSAPIVTSSQLGSAVRGEQFAAVGRNKAGDWVQIMLDTGETRWMSLQVASVDGDVMSLPLCRSTYE